MIPCQTLLAELLKVFPKMMASFWIIFFFQELGSSTLDGEYHLNTLDLIGGSSGMFGKVCILAQTRNVKLKNHSEATRIVWSNGIPTP